MKNKVILICVSLTLMGSVVFANNYQMANIRGLNFLAPTVNDKANVYDPQIGEIIYDSSDSTFYGRDQSNNWIALAGSGSGAIPTGVMLPFGGATPPTGYLLADGSAVSRTVYANLFAAIGTTFGNGDGSTTFNLPDTRNVYLRGANASTRTISTITYPIVTLGATALDQFQGHHHTFYQAPAGSGSTGATLLTTGAPTAVNTSAQVQAPTPDGANGTPRIGSETSPVNLGVNYIIKI